MKQDEILQARIELQKQLATNFEHYAAKCLKIRPKDSATTGLQPFTLNRAQKYIHALVEEQRARTGMVRAVILKGRQQGASTYISGRFMWKITHAFGVQGFILAHEENATNNLFVMAKRFYENLPALIKPEIKASNAIELAFGLLDSGYKLGTAGNKSVGRSSTIQYLHASEVAFYKHEDEHAKGIMQAVPDVAGTEIFLESTANGVSNWFHQQWQMAETGQSDFIAIFVPWFWQEEYSREVEEGFCCTSEETDLKEQYGLTDGQIAWRRNKIVGLSIGGADGEKAFRQEYPCNAVEAFVMSGYDTFIPADIVQKARTQSNVPRHGMKLMGVDCARFGDDRSCRIMRQGRVAYGMKTYKNMDLMELVGHLYQDIQQEQPDKVLVDVGGLGAGVVDRLRELCGYGLIIAVNSSNTPLNPDKYKNKRAEMWALCKEWLYDEPVMIPDSNELHADLCSTKYKPDSNSRLQMESKADMKKRGVRSSDTADALIQTFALPPSAYNDNQKSRDEVAKKIMSKYNAAKAARRH